jgi:SAM-dependent methyltransferase
VTGSFLEIGCGQGGAATVLAKHFDYTGYEPDHTSYRTAQRRLIELGTGRIINGMLPATPEDSFDAVGAFEVLEHLEDDRAAMTQWVRWLRPNGYAIVSVPAHPHRFGPWDVKVGHFRRYSRSAIETVLVDAGLVDVKVIAYGFPLGYVLEWARDWVATRKGDNPDAAGMAERTAASGRFLQPRTVAAPLIWAGTLPFVWLQRLFTTGDLGTGFVAYGRRPG